MACGFTSTWGRRDVSMWEEAGCWKGGRINGLLILVGLKNYWSLNARGRMLERQGELCFSWASHPKGHHHRTQVSTTLPVSYLWIPLVKSSLVLNDFLFILPRQMIYCLLPLKETCPRVPRDDQWLNWGLKEYLTLLSTFIKDGREKKIHTRTSLWWPRTQYWKWGLLENSNNRILCTLLLLVWVRKSGLM